MCFGSREKGDGGLARSREIEKQLRQDEKRLAKEVKLLLLGTSKTPLGPQSTSPVYFPALKRNDAARNMANALRAAC